MEPNLSIKDAYKQGEKVKVDARGFNQDLWHSNVTCIVNSSKKRVSKWNTEEKGIWSKWIPQVIRRKIVIIRKKDEKKVSAKQQKKNPQMQEGV